MKNPAFKLAPEIVASEWLNATQPFSLNSLRGKVVVLHAFQMLCPGCVSHGIPQAKSIYENFSCDEVAVIGIHTVFEHHEAMNVNALRAFMHEYRLSFPIAVDQASPESPIPITMQAYQMQGTPTLILIDKNGCIRLHEFGRPSDLLVGKQLGQLIAENAEEQAPHCDEDGCRPLV